MHRTIREHHHPVLPEHRVFQHHNERSGHDADPRYGLNILKSGTQHVAGRIVRAGYLSVRIAGLHHHGAQIQRIGDLLFGLFAGQSFGCPKLQHQFHVLFLIGIVLRIDDLRLPDIFQIEFRSQMMDLIRIPDQDQIGKPFADNPVGSLQVAFLVGFRQDDRFDVAFRLLFDFIDKFHNTNYYLNCVFIRNDNRP